MVRLASFLFASINLFGKCDDGEISTKEAKRVSEVVFQGTVEGFNGTGLERTVVFRVSRVWKGQVGRTFEMRALETTGSLCAGFWKALLVVGNELVVYASRPYMVEGIKDLLPIRSKTTLVSAAKDIRALGRGHKPK